MNTIYQLRQDVTSIAQMQRASLDAGAAGLRITHGLIGSAEWWSQVDSGALPIHTVRGMVSGFWPGQWNDGPAEFELQTEQGERQLWLCEIPAAQAILEFRIGRTVAVSYVRQSLKARIEGQINDTPITISISLE